MGGAALLAATSGKPGHFADNVASTRVGGKEEYIEPSRVGFCQVEECIRISVAIEIARPEERLFNCRCRYSSGELSANAGHPLSLDAILSLLLRSLQNDLEVRVPAAIIALNLLPFAGLNPLAVVIEGDGNS